MLSGNSRLNDLSDAIIGGAIDVHRAVGPGLLESAYQACLAHELRTRGLKVEPQKPLRLIYKDLVMPCAYRLDLVVEQQVVVEVKAVDRLLPIHHAQVMAYLKLSGYPLGLIFNFSAARLTDGLRRIINTGQSSTK